MEVKNLTEGVRLLKQECSEALRQSLTFEASTGASKLTVTVSLEAGSRRLEYAVECDWHEIGRKGQGVPQLNFYLPLAAPVRVYRYDIPFGTIEREALPQDVPANSWGLALPEKEGLPAVQLITDSNYGFRGVEDALALTLIRSSFDPDPYPELGIHKLSFAVHVAGPETSNKDLIAAAFDYTHPVEVFSGAGRQPSRLSFLELVSGSAMAPAIKAPEDGAGNELIVRLFETGGQPTEAVLRFDAAACGPIRGVEWVDVHEQAAASGGTLVVAGDRLVCGLKPYELAAVRVKFGE
jgi:alpha-mannosidase